MGIGTGAAFAKSQGRENSTLTTTDETRLRDIAADAQETNISFNDLLIQAKSNPVEFFKNIANYRNPQLEKAAIIAAQEDPSAVAIYYKNFENAPFFKEVVKAAINGNNTYSVKFFQHAENLGKEPYAGDLFKSVLLDSTTSHHRSEEFLENYTKYKDTSFGGELAKKIIERSSYQLPYADNNLFKEPWMKQVLESLNPSSKSNVFNLQSNMVVRLYERFGADWTEKFISEAAVNCDFSVFSRHDKDLVQLFGSEKTKNWYKESVKNYPALLFSNRDKEFFSGELGKDLLEIAKTKVTGYDLVASSSLSGGVQQNPVIIPLLYNEENIKKIEYGFASGKIDYAKIKELKDKNPYLYEFIVQRSSSQFKAALEIVNDKKIPFEERFIAVSLLYGAPPPGSANKDTAVNMAKNRLAIFKEAFNYSLGDLSQDQKDICENLLNHIGTFTLRRMNELHNEPRASVRFATASGLNSQQIMRLLASSGEAYTTTFRGLFDIMIDKMKTEGNSSEDLLKGLSSKKIASITYASIAYGKLPALINNFSTTEDKENFIKYFTKDIGGSEEKRISAVIVAEMINFIGKLPKGQEKSLLSNLLAQQIKENIQNLDAKTTNSSDEETVTGTRYSLMVLASRMVANKVTEDPWFKSQLENFKIPEIDVIHMPVTRLFPANNTSIQRLFFYLDQTKDRDGQVSFSHFVSTFKDSQDPWKFKDYGPFVEFSIKQNDRTIRMFANKPDQYEANDKKLDAFLRKENLTPTNYVHRGHRYHADKTLEKIKDTNPTMVFMGNCGGLSDLFTLLTITQDTYPVVTSGEGTKFINDPFIKSFMKEALMVKDNFNWEIFWDRFSKSMEKDPRIAEYIPPHLNPSFVFIKELIAVQKYYSENK